jgi:hypothetical protein
MKLRTKSIGVTALSRPPCLQQKTLTRLPKLSRLHHFLSNKRILSLQFELSRLIHCPGSTRKHMNSGIFHLGSHCPLVSVHIMLHQPYSRHAGSSNTHTSSKCGLSRAQRVKIGVQFNRREPTKEDYSHFALYQASQKTYEAVFLKDFLSHALHPRQLEACFGGDHHDQEHVEQYLRSVMTNVNQIVTKMIWNAHSRTINLLANDGKGSAHFWNFRRYKHSFGDFSPNNTFPVVHELNESWHRAFSPPQMVRYATKDYPVGTHVSPVEEIDDIAEALFRNRKLDDTLSTGRAVKPPSKKSKNRNLRTDALRAERDSDSRGDWMHDLVASSAPKISRPGHQNEPSSSANALRASHHEFQVDTVDGVDDDELPIQGTSVMWVILVYI